LHLLNREVRPAPAICLVALACLLAACSGQTRAIDDDRFGVLYTVWMKPETQSAVVKIRLSRNIPLVNWLDLAIDPERYTGFIGSGDVSIDGERVRWTPPQEDAWLQYRVELTSKRRNGEYDGRVTPDWALFRADDLVPPFRSSFTDDTAARAKLQFELPAGWSVETRYPRYTSGRFSVDDPDRKFDRPTGWLVMGEIGVRRDTIGATDVAVAAPRGQGVRYLDILAFLRATLPHLQAVFPEFPQRLLLVSAGDPMWRGALSAPNSLYVHTDRPMISGNGTSTYLHELVHVAMSARGGPGADGIVEGLAEYYSLEILRRSDAISAERYEEAHRELAAWGEEVDSIEVDRSRGPVTARAVGMLREIDRDIREKSGGSRSLDDVVRALAADERAITLERFYALVEQKRALLRLSLQVQQHEANSVE